MNQKTRPLLLGHRGARSNKSIPENTIQSFDQALADGCDGFEFDVRLTSDDEAVICHDEKVDRFRVCNSTAKELSQLPRLRDILQRYRDSFLDIELKVKGLERITLDLFLRFKPRRGFVVSSFIPGVLKALRDGDRSIPLGLICETKTQLRQWSELPVEYVMLQQELVEAELVRQIKGAGKKVFAWTVNAPADMQRFAEYGVDGMISDETGLLCRTLHS
ncbi:MAG TPA: glycerophosphodiester phosphodiesterase [Candidatus Sulfotelmatobacter sp.]|jgi:glycerophosphoryl diester phosphodiesterase|nr:glycerophosphodiester phosphodiesterase [Candidatus Sulfotelmatobacter sp.]